MTMNETSAEDTTICERILLLLAADGQVRQLRGSALAYAMSASVLLELDMLGYLACEEEMVTLEKFTEPGDKVLARGFRKVLDEGGKPLREWIANLGEVSDELRRAALACLLAKELLVRRERRAFFVLKREHLEANGDAGARLRGRILDLLRSDAQPSTEDIRLICVADVCGVFRETLNPMDMRGIETRVSALRRLDPSADAVCKGLEDLLFS